MTEPILSGSWNYPSQIRAGAGQLSILPQSCKALNMQKPLLVTDPGLAALPVVAEALELCRDAGLACGLFSAVEGNPKGENISKGVAAFHGGQHDGVIALGGGSALDAGKAVAFMSGQNRSLWAFEDIGDNWRQADEAAIAPVVAVPTTAGTGSEVGRAAVITDSAARVKRIIFHPKMLPQIVILDPELTVGLPPHITAATGMDALSHNIEALCSPFYHPMAEGIALEGIRLVKENLVEAVTRGDNLTARLHMLVASSMGATAFQKGLGAMHALAHPLGALYDAHHGTLNAVLMPYVLKANQAAIEDKIRRVSAYIGLADASFSGFLNWILVLRGEIGIAAKLSELGIDDSEAGKIGEMACADPSAGGNPVAFTPRQYTEIFLRALHGEL
ncbi:iron-containing alcohol dehydrogenase [Thalassomonas viridans]|uniref:Iron-containing alcohol dehydrogenase n=1 Tax=Thalassomonas viridans TaxID=137584 RepID=A0AAE9Z2U7_9GAMM|nr:iron-containing alcohol dehydrogenase [Thalassomonas viridans]WDE05766.1 iron-containing alcohol dehydrogenase [Thalassomonas viridans]